MSNIDILSSVFLSLIIFMFSPKRTISIPRHVFLSASNSPALLNPCLSVYSSNVFIMSRFKHFMPIFCMSLLSSNENFRSWRDAEISSTDKFCPSRINLEKEILSTAIVEVSFLIYALELYKYGLYAPSSTVNITIDLFLSILKVYSGSGSMLLLILFSISRHALFTFSSPFTVPLSAMPNKIFPVP